MEVVAWVAGPWSAARATDRWWIGALAAVVLFALPAVFNAPGDKHVTGIPTPGPARIAIEALLIAVAVTGAWYLWPIWASLLVAIIGLATVVFGFRRYRWLATGE